MLGAACVAAPAALPGARLQGEGRLQWLGLRVYDARLWSVTPVDGEDFARNAFVLELQYHRAFSGRDIAARSLTEMRRAGTFDADQAQRWESALAALLPDVQPGDRIAGEHRPGIGARFTYNGRPTGEIADERFARLFFSIWLAPTTSEPQLRAALLGGNKP